MDDKEILDMSKVNDIKDMNKDNFISINQNDEKNENKNENNGKKLFENFEKKNFADNEEMDDKNQKAEEFEDKKIKEIGAKFNLDFDKLGKYKEENINEANVIKINKKSTQRLKKIEYDQQVYNLVRAVFDNYQNKDEIIRKLRPCFSFKVIPGRDIDKIYSSLEKIDPDKIDLIEEFKYEEEKFDSTDKFETNSKSLGLSNFDLNLSVNIFSHKQGVKININEDKLDFSSKSSSKIYCIHSIFISLFRIVIDYKDIKLSRQVLEELNEIDNTNETEKKLLLEKFVEKFGLYIPLEVLVGGRINMCFEANSEEEKKDFHNILEKDIDIKLGGKFLFIKASANVEGKSKTEESSKLNSLNSIENLSIKMIGGDYLCKDNLMEWIKSFNIDNLQIIEYKTLIPIYCFLQGFEEKMKICLQDYEDIVLQEINNLIERKFKNQELNLYQGSSKNSNVWEVGITKDNYKSFTIYQKTIYKKLIIEEDETEKEDIIFGEVPDGFIIVGWVIKTNVNSKPYQLICYWEKEKDINIIGASYFKFKVKVIEEKNNYEDYMNVYWTLKIFCIHSDNLFTDYSKNYNNYYIDDDNKHYFSNCDCYKRVGKKYNKDICYYDQI